jgi:hypothetical protein
MEWQRLLYRWCHCCVHLSRTSSSPSPKSAFVKSRASTHNFLCIHN